MTGCSSPSSSPLHHPPTAACVRAERAFNRRLEGGCQVPIAAHARWGSGDLELAGLVAAPDGTELLRGVRRGAADAPEALGTGLAEELLGRGAARLLALAAHGH
ncbi:MAG: hypothetical protein KatS3mg124_0519 [Porticoccaceae bacterium]|nr:MAG: hypothetical protein KatS3mg124_0519 [Porticoccaceae bacterium]